MKGDARRAIRELVAKIYNPDATDTLRLRTKELYPLIRYMLAQKPWSELVDLTGAVNLIVGTAMRVKSADGKDATVADLASAREAWIDTVSAEILRYPRTYVTLVQLPGVDIPGPVDIAIDDRTRLVRSTVVSPATVFGPHSGMTLNSLLHDLGGLRGNQEEQGSICLEVKTNGHLDSSEGCSAASSALARVKQILQLLSLSSALTIDPRFMPNRRESQMLGYDPERASDIVRVEISEQLRQGLGSCVYTPSNIPTGLLLLGPSETPQDKILRALEPYSPLLSASKSNDDAIRVLTGLEWAFDAAVERNETQALLNACIGLEAVLGKAKETGLTDRLADRCAFMLGRGAQQRNEIADKFRRIYEVRSAVVHGRSRRLEPAQRGMLDSAKKLLHEVLQREAAEFPSQPNRK